MTRLRGNRVFHRVARALIAVGSLVTVWLMAGAPFDAGW